MSGLSLYAAHPCAIWMGGRWGEVIGSVRDAAHAGAPRPNFLRFVISACAHAIRRPLPHLCASPESLQTLVFLGGESSHSHSR